MVVSSAALIAAYAARLRSAPGHRTRGAAEAVARKACGSLASVEGYVRKDGLFVAVVRLRADQMWMLTRLNGYPVVVTEAALDLPEV